MKIEKPKPPVTLGLLSGKVGLSGHDKQWITYSKMEINYLRSNELISNCPIEHVGSTAIPSIKAKPIIDILVGLESFYNIKLIIERMGEMGYTYAHWAGIPNDYVFRNGDPTISLIHMVLYKSDHWNRMILFRNNLLCSNDLALEYEEIKINASQNEPNSR